MAGTAVIGSGGQLGSELVRTLRQQASAGEVFSLTHRDVEVTDAESVRRALTAVQPNAVINCAAWVRVDDAEGQPEEAFRVNALGALNVARACAELDALCVYISTDYVFDGSKELPYTEDDPPRPLNAYGESKVAGEHLVRAVCPKHLVVRTAGLYGANGASGKAGNFVDTIIRSAREGRPIRVVDDQTVSPTYTHDLAHKIVELLPVAPAGLYHIVNTGACSWYELATAVLALLGLQPDLVPTTAAAYKSRARRPRYSALATRKLPALGLAPPRTWPEALRGYLQEKGDLSSES